MERCDEVESPCNHRPRGIDVFRACRPDDRARAADGKDVVAGLIIGGLIGGAIANENNKKKTRVYVKTKTKTKSSGISAEQRASNREVQTALNYFGYNVGSADGSIGPKSRAAISEYQAFLGYPATGQLTEYERSVLVTGYHRAVAGGPIIAEKVSSSPYGLKSILIAQRDEMAGAPAAGSVAAAAAAAIPTLVPDNAPAAAITPLVPEGAPSAATAESGTLAAADAAPALPSFMGAGGAKGSLGTECNKVSLTTSANGGFTTADKMNDANFALSEQFCLVRTYAMASADELSQNVAGFTPAQIAEQCAAFGPVLSDHVAAVSLKPADEVLAGVEEFILTSGMSPAQLSGTAKVCLGTGYSQDDLGVAMGSALLLTALGEKAYGEFLGHHLSQGFGATERPDLAMGWYEMSLEAMGKGVMVVAPGVPGRDTLIRKAAFTINGRAAELGTEAKVEEASLPVFEVAPKEETAGLAPAAPAPSGTAAAAPVFVAPKLSDFFPIGALKP
ncbi:MAG: peptidoglycan-binding protein [Tabrizicola sp.]|nr:peptidoglycan-binding protein [Tabrizicola sp.]